MEGDEFVQGKAGQKDPDFPMHRQHLCESGLRIVGCALRKLFYPVPWEMLEGSLRQEIPFIKKQFNKRPIYAVLNLCRVVRAYESQHLLSKKQAGEWAIQNFPGTFHETIKLALNGYTGSITDTQKQTLTADLPTFFEFCGERIASRRKKIGKQE